jgi:aspartate aminotransferase-like enzyme
MSKQLDKMKAEGMDNRYKRHVEMAKYVQDWAKKNFALFTEPGYESVTVTCIKNTKGISVADLNSELGKRGYAISNGYGKIKEETFRIAHMGDLTLDEIKEVIKNIAEILKL